MTPRNLHPDLKLGVVLLTVAALLALGTDRGLVFIVSVEKLGLSARGFGFAFFPGAIAGAFVIAAAIWVDRRPAHLLMALGAVASAVGLLIIALTANVPAFIVGSFILGLGGAATGSLIIYAVAVKGATRYRGSLVGAVAIVFAAPNEWVSRWVGADRPFSSDRLGDIPLSPNLPLYVGAAMSVVAAIVLFTYLPRAVRPSPVTVTKQAAGPSLDSSIAPSALPITGHWKVIGSVTLAISLARSLSMFGQISLPYFLINGSSFGSVSTAISTISLGTMGGVLLWGIAADFLSARWLLAIAGAVFIPLFTLFGLFPGSAISVPTVLIFGVARGALVVLPWLLIAERLSVRHFGIIAVVVTFFSFIPAIFLPLIWSPVVEAWGGTGAAWVLVGLAIVLIVVVVRLPRLTTHEPVVAE